MPITFSLIVNLLFFGSTLWMGAYHLAHNSQRMAVRLTGWGVLFYAVALALEIIWGATTQRTPATSFLALDRRSIVSYA